MESIQMLILIYVFIMVCLPTTILSDSGIILKRNILKSGFHRDLESIITFPKSIKQQCKSLVWMMQETLPSGVYADPFQIQSQLQFGGPQVVFDRPVDIEAAEFVSKPHQLKVFVELDSYQPSSSHKEAISVNVKFPIHARYHSISQESSVTDATVSIDNPRLYSNCPFHDEVTRSHSVTENFNGTRQTWYQVTYQSGTSQMRFRVPVGLEKDKPVVALVTVLVTVAVSALLCKSILGSHDSELHKTKLS